jgi:hypothetical protein
MADLVAQRLLDDQNLIQQAYPAAPPSPPPDSPSDVANSLQRCETDLQSRESTMMAQMQDMMMTMMRNGPNNNSNNNNNHRDTTTQSRGDRNYNNRQRGRGRGRGRQQHRSSQPRGYCWTHGACAHTSNVCSTPATGHQTSATFDKMLGGSTNGCFWLT